ncbi:MAG TPA: hypothetical protein VKY79_05105 [Actinomycetaceae bacterium]|nr:hypothetical protein [Actinomycetaceae bacterium]
MPSEVLKARSRLGVAAKARDPEKITEARRDLAAAKLADYVAKVVAEAPPLTMEQRHRISQLLAPHAIVGGGDAA